MRIKIKVVIIYVISILVVFSTMSTNNDMPIIERMLRRLGITGFHSQGDTGWYYPTLVAVVLVILSWYFLHKTDPESKFIALVAQLITKF